MFGKFDVVGCFCLIYEDLLSAVGSEMVMVDEIPFHPQVTTTKPLTLLGHAYEDQYTDLNAIDFENSIIIKLTPGLQCITDIEIHFLQIKFTAIGVYLEPEIVAHLQPWKGEKGNELAENDDFFEALISAPVEKFIRVVIIKEIKGSQYGVQLESAVRDRLAADDKYEEEEEEALEKLVEFFQSKYFKKHSIGFVTEGKQEVKLKVENANVVEMIQKWYLGGTRGVSATTVASLADGLSALLSK
ncbi:Chalcone isomerase-like protein 2 [Asimina triloba]